MNWGSRTPLSSSRRQRIHGVTAVPAPRRRRLMLLIAASLAACALAQATPALGIEATITSQTVLETDIAKSVDVTIALDGPALGGEQVTIDLNTLDAGTATSPNDYTFAPATVTFAMTETSTTVPLTITGDTVHEANQTINLELSNPMGLSITSPLGTVAITDNHTAPTLAISDPTVIEGGNLVFTVTRTGDTELTAGATYTIGNGTAIAPGDFVNTVPTGTISIAPAATTDTITVTTNDDAIFEANEAVTATLSLPTNATLSDGAGLGTITDNDTAPTLAISGQAVAEGTAVTFTVTRTGATELAASATVNTADGTPIPPGAVAPADYAAIVNGTVSVAAGLTPASTTFTVATVNDALFEANETFTAVLTAPVNATLTGVGAPTSINAIGTINNNDTAPTILIGPATVNPEGTSAVNSLATFPVTLSAASGLDVTALYSTANGLATANPPGAVAPGDYSAATNATLTIPIGQTGGTITIPVIADNMFEPATETFTVTLGTLTNATLASLANGTATGTITDDDLQPVITINNNTAPEGDSLSTTPPLTVTLSNPSYQIVSVMYATTNGTATAPADYTAIGASSRLDFLSGETTKTVPIRVIGDVLDEADLDTVSLNLTNPVNATFVQPPVTNPPTPPVTTITGVLSITDDDAMPTVSFQSPSSETHPEGDSGVTTRNIVIVLDAPSGRNVTVFWQTADIALFAPNATASVDYVPVNNSVVFTPGQLTKSLSVSVIGDDNAAEGSESIGLQLNSADFATIPPGSIKQLVILEDDVVNVAPVATGDSLNVARNGSATINVRTNDVDANGDALFVSANASAGHGTATCQFTGACTYTPNRGYVGPDAFTYTINDGQATAAGTVTIMVVNATPVANPDRLVTGQGAPGAVNVLANDIDADGGPLSITSSTRGAHGSVACGSGMCNYVPAAGFIGADKFTYVVKDPDGGTAVGTVNVTVAKGIPLTMTAKANTARSRRGAANGYTITIRNPNRGPVTITSVSVCIPTGFSYAATSVSRPLARVPVSRTCGAGKAKLTWTKKVTIKGNGAVAFRFKVAVGGPLTTARITATAKAANKFAVTPLKPGAPIVVAAR